MNDDIIIIERFSKKRYETYKAKGIPFHVVCGKGRLCEVKAFDCGDNHDQVFVESTYEYLGKARTSGHYANQKNGCTQYREQDGKLFIYRGPWFKHNDLVVQTRDGIAGREIFFWHGIRPKDNMFLANWGAYSPYDDLHDSDFSQCTLGCDLKTLIRVVEHTIITSVSQQTRILPTIAMHFATIVSHGKTTDASITILM